MGLTEKRLAKQIQDTALPAFEAAVKSIAGYMPVMDIDWDTFIAYDEFPLTRLEGDILPGLMEVFQRICRDEMGTEALPGVLERIKLENTDNPDAVELRLANKELYHKVQLAGEVYKRYAPEQIIELIEKAM